jgi:hypothetical protein
VVSLIPLLKYPVSVRIKLSTVWNRLTEEPLGRIAALGYGLVDLVFDAARATLFAGAPVHDRPREGGRGE